MGNSWGKLPCGNLEGGSGAKWLFLPYDIGKGVLQGALFVSSLGSKMVMSLARCGVPNGSISVCRESLLQGCSSRRAELLSLVDGEVEVHAFPGTGEVVGGPFLNVLSSDVPGCGPGEPHDFSIDWGEFRPLKVGAVRIEGVFLPSVFESEELSGVSLILFGIDVCGDVDEPPGSVRSEFTDFPC